MRKVIKIDEESYEKKEEDLRESEESLTSYYEDRWRKLGKDWGKFEEK